MSLWLFTPSGKLFLIFHISTILITHCPFSISRFHSSTSFSSNYCITSVELYLYSHCRKIHHTTEFIFNHINHHHVRLYNLYKLGTEIRFQTHKLHNTHPFHFIRFNILTIEFVFQVRIVYNS